MNATLTELPEEWAEVDLLMERSIAAGDPLIAVNYGNKLYRGAIGKGTALAKLLFELQKSWALFQAAGINDTWEDYASANIVNLSPQTARKYASMWETIFVKAQLSDGLRAHLAQGTPIASLLLLTAGVREGSITEDALQEVPLLNYQGTRDLVRQARGQQTSSSMAITGHLIMRDGDVFPKGTIFARQNGEMEPVAMLRLEPDTEFGKQYLERIKNALHLQERG